MELSYEEAQKVISSRLDELPKRKTLVTDASFDETLRKILTFEGVDESLLPIIKNEVLVVLAEYAPIGELPGNIAESTEVSEDTAQKISVLIESLLFSEFREELEAFEYHWNTELAKTVALTDTDIDLKERLELRPKGVERDTNTPERAPKPSEPVPGELKKDGEVTLADIKIIATPGKDGVMEAKKPLTKEEILGALMPHRTMASDIAAVRGETEPKPAGTPTPIIEHLKAPTLHTEEAAPKKVGEKGKPVVGYDALS
jgi:hypothetical protein